MVLNLSPLGFILANFVSLNLDTLNLPSFGMSSTYLYWPGPGFFRYDKLFFITSYVFGLIVKLILEMVSSLSTY
jgi:hypothetical protein